MVEICSAIPIATSSRSRLTRTTAQITTIVVAEKMETVRNLRGLGTLGIRPRGGALFVDFIFSNGNYSANSQLILDPSGSKESGLTRSDHF